MSRNKQHGGRSGHDDHDGHNSGHRGKLLVGTNGDNVLVGTGRNDVILGRNGDDSIDGGAGNDWLFGGKGNDLLDGGAGNDRVLGGKGDDVANFTLSENLGAHDVYDGGKGFDTLRLTLTTAEADLAKDEIALFRAFLLHKANPHSDGGRTFHFQNFNLDVRNFEKLEIVTIGGNTAPVAVNNSYSLGEDSVLIVATAQGVLTGDTDTDGDVLSAKLVAGPTHGSLTLNADGSFTYTPDADFNGTDSFTYVANDGALDSSPATVSLAVNAVNDRPLADPESYSTNEDTPLTVATALGVLAGDTDVDGDALSARVVSNPSNGSLTLNADGSFTYTPKLNFFGSDSFTYVANDGALDSDPATVSLTVNAVNDEPVAGDDTITATALDGRIHVAVVGKQNVPGELDGSSYIAAAGQLNPALFNATAIAHTTTTTKAEWATILAGFDVVVIGDDGLGADYTGSSIFSALFDFATAGGGVVTTGWFATALNEYTNPLAPGVPDIDADRITPIASGAPSGKLAPATIDVVDQSHPITTGIISYQAEAAAHDLALSLDNTPTARTLATWTSAGGEVRQAIAVDQVGSGLTAFLGNLYLANDAFFSTAALRSGDADLIFERAVAWAAGARSGPIAATVIIDVLANDTDVDTAHADLFISSFTQPGALGAATSVNANGDVVYTLGAQGLLDLLAGQAVTDSFDYTVSDGSGGFDTASVNLTITGLNDTLL